MTLGSRLARGLMPLILLTPLVAHAELPPVPASAGQHFTLGQLERLTLQNNPAIQAARHDEEAAEARTRTARALPNPDIEYLAGNASPRAGGTVTGTARSYGLSLPLDTPWRRLPRIATADAGLDAARQQRRAFEADVIAELRQRFYDVLRREAELKNALEDQRLTEDIRARIKARVDIGEAGRFELIKADAEALNARQLAEAASRRAVQARTVLQRVTGLSLPTSFQLNGRLDDIPGLRALDDLSNELQVRSPDLLRARAEVERASQSLRLERGLRWPALSLKGTIEEEPDVKFNRIGLSATLPIFDQRQGPVDEARAQLARAQRQLQQADLVLTQGLIAAVQQYEIAAARVTALETGILRQTEAALNVAQIAYRHGERSFLDVLDAQRVHRAARNDLIAARTELATAWIEIERLRAAHGETPE